LNIIIMGMDKDKDKDKDMDAAHARELLGLKAQAEGAGAADDIRRAYKQAALRWHPDKNPGKDASTMFARVNAAYELLMRLVRVDPGGDGVPPRHGRYEPEHAPDPEDLDVHVIDVSLRELYLGGTRRLEFASATKCRSCGGTGAASPADVVACIACRGYGRGCVSCGGSGSCFRTARRCASCGGAGRGPRLTEHREVSIPAGVQDMHVNDLVVVDAAGRPGFAKVVYRRPDLPAGTHVTPDGDVRIVARIDLADVLCGFSRTLPIFGGAASIQLSAAGYEPPDRLVTYPGLGLPRPWDPRARGAVTVSFEVAFPRHDEGRRLGSMREVFCKIFRVANLAYQTGKNT
jgi:DnaJ-class molecular chaperone